MDKLPLELIFGPGWKTDFYKVTRSSAPFHIPGDNDKYRWLMNHSLFSRLLNRNQNSIGSIPWRIFRSGKEIRCENAQHVKNAISEGASVIFNNADQYSYSIGDFITCLSRQTSCASRANIYYSQPSIPAFNVHWDAHSFFIIQCEGRKEWRIWDQQVETAVFFGRHFDTDPPKEDPDWVIELTEGDALFVPIGFWHEALCIDRPSIHLTIGMFPPNQIDFLVWLAREMYDEPEYRRTFPLILAGDEADHWKQLIEKTLEYPTKMGNDIPTLLEQFLRFRAEAARNYNPFTEKLLSSRKPTFNKNSRCRITRGMMHLGKMENCYEVVTWGEKFRFNLEQEKLVKFLASKSEFSGNDVPNEAWGFINELIEKGLVDYA